MNNSSEQKICDSLIAKMREYFGDDQRRIDHAMQVLGYADEILAHEPGSALVVRAAAILHDIGIPESERKYNSSAGKYQEIEGPPIARGMMEELSLDKDVVDHVCTIIGSHHSARGIDTPEFRIIWDADWLVNIVDEPRSRNVFKTPTGRRIASDLNLGKGDDVSK